MCRRLPRAEQPALAAELRKAAYAVVLRIAAGAAARGPERQESLHRAQQALAEIETILCIAHDLEYLQSADFARLEARAEETGKTLYGLLRKMESPSLSSSPSPSGTPP